MTKLTESDVRSAIKSAIFTTGDDEREEIDYVWLTAHLNDLIEQGEKE